MHTDGTDSVGREPAEILREQLCAFRIMEAETGAGETIPQVEPIVQGGVVGTQYKLALRCNGE
jgi:hypothetical protein